MKRTLDIKDVNKIVDVNLVTNIIIFILCINSYIKCKLSNACNSFYSLFSIQLPMLNHFEKTKSYQMINGTINAVLKENGTIKIQKQLNQKVVPNGKNYISDYLE